MFIAFTQIEYAYMEYLSQQIELLQQISWWSHFDFESNFYKHIKIAVKYNISHHNLILMQEPSQEWNRRTWVEKTQYILCVDR